MRKGKEQKRGRPPVRGKGGGDGGRGYIPCHARVNEYMQVISSIICGKPPRIIRRGPYRLRLLVYRPDESLRPGGRSHYGHDCRRGVSILSYSPLKINPRSFYKVYLPSSSLPPPFLLPSSSLPPPFLLPPLTSTLLSPPSILLISHVSFLPSFVRSFFWYVCRIPSPDSSSPASATLISRRDRTSWSWTKKPICGTLRTRFEPSRPERTWRWCSYPNMWRT